MGRGGRDDTGLRVDLADVPSAEVQEEEVVRTRHSVVRKQAGLIVDDFGVPIDVLPYNSRDSQPLVCQLSFILAGGAQGGRGMDR